MFSRPGHYLLAQVVLNYRHLFGAALGTEKPSAMATMMSSCSQTKLGLEFTFHQALNHYIKQVSTAPNLNTWHSSQTSPSPHRGSADSKSSNLNFVCWMCFASMGPEKELFCRHWAVEDVFIGLVHCSQDCTSFNLTSQLVIMTEMVNWPALYKGHHCLWCMPVAGEYCLCD